MLPVPGHVEVAVAEGVVTVAEHRRIQELVRAKDIDRLVCDNRSRQQHPVLRPGAKPVHALARRNVVRFDLVPFVADDDVSGPGSEFVFEPPSRFVVDHRDLKADCRNLSNFLGFSRSDSFDHGK